MSHLLCSFFSKGAFQSFGDLWLLMYMLTTHNTSNVINNIISQEFETLRQSKASVVLSDEKCIRLFA